MIEIQDCKKELDTRCGACAEHAAEDGSSICQTCWESDNDDVWWQAMNYGSFDTFD